MKIGNAVSCKIIKRIDEKEPNKKTKKNTIFSS